MIGIKSDVGNIRTLNEDYADFYECENFKIYVVADGMGGHNAGEVASKTAVKSLVKYIRDNFGKFDNNHILEKAIKHANIKVFNLAHFTETYNGMGTTLVACLITKDMIQVANIGDSSCYGIKCGEITKITKDHSLVQELLDSGSISEEEAKNHPRKNVITRAIGTKEIEDVDIFNIEKDRFDFFLICSDGLSNDINIEEILSFRLDKEELQSICEKLIQLAKSKGGRDNITVMLFEGGV